MLGTNDPYEGVEVLNSLARRLGDARYARAIRNALGVDVPRLKNAQARREAAIEQVPGRTALIPVSLRTLYRDEDKGIQELARLVLEHSAKVAGLGPEEADDLDASAERDESDDQPSSPADPEEPSFLQTLRSTLARETKPTTVAREYARELAVAAVVMVGVTGVAVLAATGNLSKKPDSTPPPDKVVSATLPSGVNVKGAAAPKLDNSRGWGPERKNTYTWKHPASFPVFNSITDNPYHGDERNFLQCKDTAKDGQSWADELVAKDGHTYKCYLYIGNDVAPNLDTNVAARLQNARVHLSLPDERTLNPGITGILSADNAPQVWDSCNFVAARPVTLIYESDSARLHTNGTPKDGSPLPGAIDGLIHDNGALLGDKGDGIVGQNAGYLTFRMTAVLG
ncbi:hypothetical protein [Streptomyces sp. 029-5]|uniref:hypothetical protein n=1 Tax=Streptomyces sp. 029-5 TaxID=2789261 RepID=UPI00398041E3